LHTFHGRHLPSDIPTVKTVAHFITKTRQRQSILNWLQNLCGLNGSQLQRPLLGRFFGRKIILPQGCSTRNIRLAHLSTRFHLNPQVRTTWSKITASAAISLPDFNRARLHFRIP